MNTHHAVANELDPSASDDLANDNLRHEGQPHAMTGQEEAIISAAVLVATLVWAQRRVRVMEAVPLPMDRR